jgi:hypothetical protein
MDTFRYLTLLCLLRARDLRLISVWHPSFLTLLFDALAPRWNDLLADIASGACSGADALPAKLRAVFASRPQPQRARELGRRNPSEPSGLWPELRVVSCWGDAQAALAVEALRRRLPRVTIQRKGLLATEGIVSIPFREFHPLAVTSHFFEFADANGGIWLGHELRQGETYSVIITTGAGLWRYALGDLVEVDGFVGKTPSLRFVGRGGRISDLCGEKLSEGFVGRAIEMALAAADYRTGFAMLAPEQDGTERSHYTLFVGGDTPNTLAAHLDEALARNPHYEWCRRLGQLEAARVCTVGEDAYALFCRVAMAEGARLGEIKPRSLSPRTDWRTQFARVTAGVC